MQLAMSHLQCRVGMMSRRLCMTGKIGQLPSCPAVSYAFQGSIILSRLFRYSSYSTASIFITTFNVNGRVPPPEAIPKWLTFNGNPPDFYVVGCFFHVFVEVSFSFEFLSTDVTGSLLPNNPWGLEEAIYCWHKRVFCWAAGKRLHFTVISQANLVFVFMM